MSATKCFFLAAADLSRKYPKHPYFGIWLADSPYLFACKATRIATAVIPYIVMVQNKDKSVTYCCWFCASATAWCSQARYSKRARRGRAYTHVPNKWSTEFFLPCCCDDSQRSDMFSTAPSERLLACHRYSRAVRVLAVLDAVVVLYGASAFT